MLPLTAKCKEWATMCSNAYNAWAEAMALASKTAVLDAKSHELKDALSKANEEQREDRKKRASEKAASNITSYPLSCQ